MGKTLKRRRKEAKTNYLKRLNMLKGKVPRIIFRKSNKYILAQLIISKNAQDKVELSLSSKALLNYGWPKEASNSLKTLPAAYLTGLLIGKKIKEKTKEKKFVIDIGLNRNVHKSKIYAFINGLNDAGISITEKKEIFPEPERLKGKHMKNEIIFKKFDEIKKKAGGN